MEPVSRRTFFKHAGAAAAVAVVAGSTAAVPLGLSTALAGAATTNDSKDRPLTPTEQLSASEDLVAYVKNARTGEISLFVGEREVTIHDPKTAARLVRAIRK